MTWPFFDLVAELDDRLLVLAGPLVEADELAKRMHFRSDLDPLGVDVRHRALVAGANDHARVQGHVALQAGADDRRLGDQQRHRLPLHVRAHQGPVGVVVLQERNQTGRHADHLARRDVDVLNLVDRDQLEVGPVPGDDRIALNLVVVDRARRPRRRYASRFLVGPQPDHVVGQLAPSRPCGTA